MKISEQDVVSRKVDKALTIVPLFTGVDFNFDCVVGELNGLHERVVNKVSDRMYYILDGDGKVSVESNVYSVSQGDLIVIRKNMSHGLQGNLRYLIMTSPPYDPQNEEKV